jgi:hypothetical protein
MVGKRTKIRVDTTSLAELVKCLMAVGHGASIMLLHARRLEAFAQGVAVPPDVAVVVDELIAAKLEMSRDLANEEEKGDNG